MKVMIKGNPFKFLNQANICEEKWTPTEDEIILDMAKASPNPWRELSSRLCRSPSACLGRYKDLVKENRRDHIALKRRTTAPAPKPCKGAVEESRLLSLPRKRSKTVSQASDDPIFLPSFDQALQHLREEVNVSIQRLSQANLVLEQQIKERDDNYSELDSKFTRLHEHIQHVQKEKDDLEAQLRDANDKVGRALSEISAMKHELDRARKQASETLEAMVAEKQQLQNMNNKLCVNIKELLHSLEPKEHALEALQQSLSEKEQVFV